MLEERKLAIKNYINRVIHNPTVAKQSKIKETRLFYESMLSLLLEEYMRLIILYLSKLSTIENNIMQSLDSYRDEDSYYDVQLLATHINMIEEKLRSLRDV